MWEVREELKREEGGEVGIVGMIWYQGTVDRPVITNGASQLAPVGFADSTA